MTRTSSGGYGRWATSSELPERAIPHWLQPGHPARTLTRPLITLGWAYWRAGREREAVAAYQRLLEIHEGTPLAEQVRSGRQPTPDEEVAAEMYEIMLDSLAAAGYEQYEISNFAKPGFESRHNSKYWTLDPVFGFGVSAHSFDGRQRYANERDTAKYVAMIERTASAEVVRENIDLASEFVFLGLRMEDGIDLAREDATMSKLRQCLMETAKSSKDKRRTHFIQLKVPVVLRPTPTRHLLPIRQKS